MLKFIKKLTITSLITMSIFVLIPVGASAEWKKDNNQNYYWMEKGAKAIGWKFINGNWYNFRSDGVMQVSWVQDKGNWYYLWSNGTMASDTWLNKAGSWYYFDSTGKMIYDSTIVGARQYDFTKPALITSKDLNNSNSIEDLQNKGASDSSTKTSDSAITNFVAE